MIIFCVYCNNQYDHREGQPNWGKTGISSGGGSISSSKYCSYLCGRKHQKQKQEERNMKLYGVKHHWQREDFQQLRKDNWIKTLGVDNPQKLKSVQEKTEETNLKIRGVKRPLQSKDSIEKMKVTNKEKIGCEFPLQNISVQNKYKKTNIEKIGVGNPFSDKGIREEIQNKWNKNKSSIIEKISENNKTKAPQALEKRLKTNIELFGVDNYSKTDKFKSRYNNSDFVKTVIDKVSKTKLVNGTFNTSKVEQEIFVKLKEKFGEVLVQYKSDLYPFNCDFFIPSLNLYMEYQGSWTHGGHPYVDNKDCNIILNKWIEKSKYSDFYKIAIETWTVRDVNKRLIAKNNKLNWIEFFTEKEFKKWYNEQ